MRTIYLILVTVLLAPNLLAAQNDPPAIFSQPCNGTDAIADMQGSVLINGQLAVAGEDYVAFFDSDGFVIGTDEVKIQPNGCGAGTDISFINVAIYGVSSQIGLGCPDDYGLTSTEPINGLLYDGSTDTYYSISSDQTFVDNATLNLQSGNFCAEFNATVLPVTLTSFRGRATGAKQARLDWEVAREENVSHYEVQRSRNGREWTTLDEVAAAGNSAETLYYGFTDNTVTELRHFYRLRMVDTDGSAEFSGIVIVEFADDGERTVNVFPNPASPYSRLSIQLRGEWREDLPITGELIDATGRRVATYSNLASGTVSVALPAGAHSGLYAVRIHQADRTVDRKVIIR